MFGNSADSDRQFGWYVDGYKSWIALRDVRFASAPHRSRPRQSLKMAHPRPHGLEALCIKSLLRMRVLFYGIHIPHLSYTDKKTTRNLMQSAS